jgi:hypothetical protein
LMVLTQELKVIKATAVFVPLFDWWSSFNEALTKQHFGIWTCGIFIGFLLSCWI